MAGESVSAITPYYGGLYNNYANSVMLDDLCGFGSTTGMMSMNDSLFSGMTMPFMPSFTGGGINYETYFNNMEKYQDFMYDSQIRQADKRREVNYRANAPEMAMDEQLEILHEKIMRNEQQQVIPALKALLQSIAATYGQNASQEDLIAMAKNQYKQKYQTSLSDDLRKYGNGSLTQGFLQTATLGFADKRTPEENISIIDNQPVGRWENTKKLMGNAAGGALVGGIGMYVLSSLKWAKALFKSKPLVAAGIGAAAGLLAGAGIGALNQSSSARVTSNSSAENS